MKRFILFLSVLPVMCCMAHAQGIVEVCGTQTITLRTGNYQYGTIQWERSADHMRWESIPGANDTLYTFMPDRDMFYRAVASFSMCPQEFSETVHVTMPTVANAGFDRTVPDQAVGLMANTAPGAEGVWSILEGIGGSLSDINNPYATFQGADTLYLLTWTLTNRCGSSTDTMQVLFRENQYVKQLAIVDDTDQFLSDSLQMAAGLYMIRFSDPAPEITDSTILVGITHGGFLRKVESFTVENGTYTMQTSQATLEDIIVEGSFDLAYAMRMDTTITTNKSPGNYQRLSSMPTRRELTTNPMFRTGNYYYIIDQHPVYVRPGVQLEKQAKDGTTTLRLNFNSTLLDQQGFKLELNGYYNFTPNFVADLDYSWRKGLIHFKMGLSNAIAVRNIELKISAVLAELLSLEKSFTLFSFKRDMFFVVGTVPILVTATFSVEGKASASIGASMNITNGFTETCTYDAYIEYKNNNWDYVFNDDSSLETSSSLVFNGNISQDFEIGPTFSVTLFRILGPYVDLRLTEDFDLCTDFTYWQTNLNIGGSLTLGAKAEVLSKTLIDISNTWTQGFYHYQFPHKLEVVSGNNQTYTPGNPLTHPVKVQVKSNKNLVLPGARVKFEPMSGGSVSQSMVTANTGGYAETSWTPGGTEQSTLRVISMDCSGSNISLSPMLFSAYAGTTMVDCTRSSLTVNIVKTGQKIRPQVHMGVAPYTYSTDDVTYNAQVPELVPEMSHTYFFHVKDAEGCSASSSYTEQPEICRYSGLSLDLETMGNTIIASAYGGSPPYVYALNDPNGEYTSNQFFISVPVGRNVLYVKDEDDCVAMQATVVHREQHPGCGIIVDARDGNIYKTAQIGNQCWMAENLRYLPEVTGGSGRWSSATEPRYAVNGYTGEQNDPEEAKALPNYQDYGVLYNWVAARAGAPPSDANPSGVQGVCPAGWHLPSEAEWIELIEYMYSHGYGPARVRIPDTSGSALKSCRQVNSPLGGDCNTTEHPRWNATTSDHGFDEFGFAALPGGYRYDSFYSSLGYHAYWWSATEYSASAKGARIMYNTGGISSISGIKSYGYSVRCVRD